MYVVVLFLLFTTKYLLTKNMTQTKTKCLPLVENPPPCISSKLSSSLYSHSLQGGIEVKLCLYKVI